MTIFKDIDAISSESATLFAQLARQAILDHGRFVVALSGGSTPKRLFTLLANPEWRDKIDWSKVFALFGDERYVPPTDPQSNEKMARETLLDHVPVPTSHVYPMYRPGGPELAASAYEGDVSALLGPDLKFDLVLLGLGPDGHTASLFPGDPSVHEQRRLVVASVASANARDRITMTPGLINRAATVLFLIAGEDKAAPLKRMLEGEIDFDLTPSQAIARVAPNVLVYADQAAAGQS